MKRLPVIVVLMVATTFGINAAHMPLAHAAVDPAACDTSSVFLGLPPWYKYLDVAPDDSGGCSVMGPIDEDTGSFNWRTNIGRIALAIVEMLLRIVGLIAVGYVIYGGIKYIMSQGEPDKTKSAKNTVVNALIGAAIAIAATAIVNLIGGALM